MRVTLPTILLLANLPAHAVTPLSQSEQGVFNFGFATQLGSGIYSISGRTLQVYRLPFEYAVPAADDARLRTRVTLPVTIGFANFQPRDVLTTGLPEHVDSVSFVPGVAVDIRVREQWVLEPFVEAGIARDRTSRLDERVFSVGLRSTVDFRPGHVDWQQYDEVVHVIAQQQGEGRSDDFTRLRVALTGRRPFDLDGIGPRADCLGYGMVELFTNLPDGPTAGARGSDGQAQFEVGVTFGSTGKMHLWRIPLPRVGLGYRFGHGLAVYRIVLGSPF